jgi:hypothetical protein
VVSVVRMGGCGGVGNRERPAPNLMPLVFDTCSHASCLCAHVQTSWSPEHRRQIRRLTRERVDRGPVNVGRLCHGLSV